jgi:hypothetical protein
MTTFRFRIVLPRRLATPEGKWLTMESSENDWRYAANEYHFQRCGKEGTSVMLDHETVHFLIFENEAGDRTYSRTFSAGIRRRGRVVPTQEKWQRAAAELETTAKELRELADGKWEKEDEEWTDSCGNKVPFDKNS